MRKKNNFRPFVFTSKHLQVFLQKINLSVHFFLKNELFNHAGAAAFFFLLSVTPVFLLLLIAFDHYLISYPDVSVSFFGFLKSINDNLDKDFLIKIGLLNVNTTTIGIFGLVNLLWAGRSILTSIQRGLGVIFPSEKIRTPLVVNAFSFIILSFLLFLSVLATFISMGINLFQAFQPESLVAKALLLTFLPAVRRLLPFLIIFLVIFLAYRFVPPRTPKSASSLTGALWCASSVILLHTLFSRFFDVTQYNVIYGVLGSLILMVLWIYFSFVLFFFFAEYTFVSDKIDVLVLERLYFFRLQHDVKKKRIEKFLYNHPKRIFEKYAKHYRAGDVIFQQGHQSTEIYFIQQGSVGIYRKINDKNEKIATLAEGEVFGEMAYLLDENRTATAVTEVESFLMTVSPAIFEELLQVNNTISRNVIQLLCNRLRKTHFTERP
jgi:membrane protein